jgi:hypothetical protein
MGWHALIDERNYEMHQVIADLLREDPAKLDLALAWMEKFLSDADYSGSSKDALNEWRDLIRSRGLKGVLELLAERSENATRMRHMSPFAVLMPQEKRMEILQRYEARRPRAHPSGV